MNGNSVRRWTDRSSCNASSDGSRGGAGGGGGPPLFLDQNEARRAEKNFFETAPPISGSGWLLPPLSESLDPPLASYTAMLFIASYCGTWKKIERLQLYLRSLLTNYPSNLYQDQWVWWVVAVRESLLTHRASSGSHIKLDLMKILWQDLQV